MLQIYNYWFLSNFFFFKKLNFFFFKNRPFKINFLFKLHKNIPYTYTWFFLKKQKLNKIFFKKKNFLTKFNALRFFTKPTYLVYNARLVLKQLFFLKKPSFYLTNIINIFFNWTGSQIYLYFYKNLFFFYKNLFFFYKNLFFFYKKFPLLVNNIKVCNFWYNLKSGDILKFITNVYILMFFFKKLYFFKNKKFFKKILFLIFIKIF